MRRHNKSKGLLEGEVKSLYYLFDHLKGAGSNVISLGGITYTKVVECRAEITNGSLIKIKVERSEL